MYVNSIFADLGPDENSTYELHHYFTASENTMFNTPFSVEGYKNIVQFNASLFDNGSLEQDSTSFDIRLKNNHLDFKIKKDSSISISLLSKFESLVHYAKSKDSMKSKDDNGSSTLKVINESSQTISIPKDSMILLFENKKLVFSTIEFLQVDTIYTIQRVEGFLLD